MVRLNRYERNPILTPDEQNAWEAECVFNASVVKNGDYNMLYRAISKKMIYYESEIEMSTIGYACGKTPTEFSGRKQFITPEAGWEQYGCEDPRVTKFDDKYYIFYTALADFPHTAHGIKVAVAITSDFKEIEKKHLVTPFNAKAMALFPEKVNGKYAVVFSKDTDNPPVKISIALMDKISDLWDIDFWDKWLDKSDKYILELKRNEKDHVEVGAPPVLTDKGWLMIYSYIKNYFEQPVVFGVEAVLLDKNDPTKIIGRTQDSMMEPLEEYELYGKVPNIVFPTSVLVEGNKLLLYYGGADTNVSLATVELDELLDEMTSGKKINIERKIALERYDKNPIISPNSDNPWEAKCTYNPTATYLDGKAHILYRAQSNDNTSTIGYAVSKDGFVIDERLDEPIYVPREDFEEKKSKPHGFSGCEDARLTLMEDKLYMCYTAYDGVEATKIALTSISVDDFLKRNWNWEKPKIISDPSRDDKNACLLPEKIDGKYVFFHRIGGCIWIDFVNSLDFDNGEHLGGKIVMCPRDNGCWCSRKVGIGGTPIKTDSGWILIYHGLSKDDNKYRLSAALLDLNKPDVVLKDLKYPIIEPEAEYEKSGLREQTIFTCGNIVVGDKLMVYYGGGDTYTAVASIKLDTLLKELTT